MIIKPNPKGTYGNIDSYFVDQFLKETYAGWTNILDAGSGEHAPYMIHIAGPKDTK